MKRSSLPRSNSSFSAKSSSSSSGDLSCSSSSPSSSEPLAAGGQAVIEGVMMRYGSRVATAVRLPNKQIKVKIEMLPIGSSWKKKPFLRGVFSLVDMLVLGLKSLIWSTNQQLEKEEQISSREIFVTLFFTLFFALLLFVGLPYGMTHWSGLSEEKEPFLFNILDGIIRLIFFIGYVLLISLSKDIRRVFMYHGAEHKAVHCFEAGEELTVTNVSKHTPLHHRCGTSFLLLVLLTSILIFAVLPSLVLVIYPSLVSLSFWEQRGIMFPLRLLMIPLIASVSYEVLKLSARKSNSTILRLISAPGLLVQRLTTREPTSDQIEVALAALRSVVPDNLKLSQSIHLGGRKK